MVPCQPRQLVIFSLPFAALVAFFWFKRRRSLSRSDPGGTLEKIKEVDNSPELLATEETAAVFKLNGHCVKDIGDTCNTTPSVDTCTVTSVKTVTHSLNTANKVVESISSQSEKDTEVNISRSKQIEEGKSSEKKETEAVDVLQFDECCAKDIQVACNQTPLVEECAVTNIKTVSVSPNKADKVVESTSNQLVKDTDVNTACSRILCEIKSADKDTTERKGSKNSVPETNEDKLNSEGEDFYFENLSAEDIEQVERKLIKDFESNELFNSTPIENEDQDKFELNNLGAEDKPLEKVLHSDIDEISSTNHSQSGDTCIKENKLDNANVTVKNIHVKKEDLDTTLTNIKLEEGNSDISLEEQRTLENTCLDAVQTEEHLQELESTDKSSEIVFTQAEQIDKSSILDSNSDLGDKVVNLSSDTGLGSQDLSTTEDSQTEMAQGHSTENAESNATGLEQKLASLGLDTQQAAQRAERDSANHSPAEVMLNSPAISTFSDAHSEGSSDSGKGCSDVVTPPSRTPAGGSSVAGDQVPSVYEFVLPQVIVGRLIGRHGAFLNDIKAKTHSNVFIKRHPETNSLKICAIEGTQPDIDAALKMIRQKFPLRRFPDLTLERVSFVKSSSLPINPENLQLHLVEGLNNDVLVSYMETAGHMFLQLPMHMSYHSLYRLACIMNTVYNTEESPLLADPRPDVLCVAPAPGGWYRAQILSVDEEAHTSDVRFVDYGAFLTVDNSLLRQIRGDFMLLPFQAVECFLANVVPAGGEAEWSKAANEFVRTVTSHQILQAQVYDYTDTGLPLVYLYFTQFYQSPTDPSGLESRVVLLNQELVSHGYADLIDDATPEEDVQPSECTIPST